MDAQSVASMQKQLRSAFDDKDFGPSVVKHMQKVEDFSSEPTQRDAFRKARSQGHLKFIFNGTIFVTRLKTETRQEHVKDMLERAKSAAGPEVVGMPGDETPPDDFGGELPMAESKKINIKQLDKLIIEEIKNVQKKGKKSKVILEQTRRQKLRMRLAKKNNCVPPSNPNFRQRRANWRRFKRKYNLKKGQWPHAAFPAYSVKGPDNKPDDRASFEKFYAAVKADKCAYIALGGLRKMRPIGRYPFDFKFGDQHSDAYSQLNPETRATGGVEIDDTTIKQLRGTSNVPGGVEGGSTISPDNKMRFFDDPMAYNIASYEKYSRMGEKQKRQIVDLLSKIKAYEKAMANIEARRKKISAEEFEGGVRAPQGTGGGPNDPRVQFLQRRKQWSAERLKKLRRLTASFESHTKKRDETGKKLNMLRKAAAGAGKVAQAAASSAKRIGNFRKRAEKQYPGIDLRKPGIESLVKDLFNTVDNYRRVENELSSADKSSYVQEILRLDRKIRNSMKPVKK